MRTTRQRFVVALVLSLLAACAAAPREAYALSRGAAEALVREVLDSLGVTTNGVYTPAGGATGSDGTVGSPAVRGTDADSGFYWTGSGKTLNLGRDGTNFAYFNGDSTLTMTLDSEGGGGFQLTGASGQHLRMDNGGIDITNLRAMHPAPNARAVDKTLGADEMSGNVYTTLVGASALVTFTLPSSPADGNHAWFKVTDTHGIKVLSNSGQVIRLAGNVTADGGYIHSIGLGSIVHLEWDAGSGSWTCDGPTGVWRMGTTSGSGFAYTPTAWTSPASISTTGWVDANHTTTECHRQIGNNLEVRYCVAITGAVSSAAVVFPLPAGYTIDTTAEPTSDSLPFCGTGQNYDQSVGAVYPVFYYQASTTSVKPASAAGFQITETNPGSAAQAANDRLTGLISVPVQ